MLTQHGIFYEERYHISSMEVKDNGEILDQQKYTNISMISQKENCDPEKELMKDI